MVQSDIQFQHYSSINQFHYFRLGSWGCTENGVKNVHSRKKGHLAWCLGKAQTETGWHTSVNYYTCKHTQLPVEATTCVVNMINPSYKI